ncbi:hypothetical protein [Spirulina subsalsa]|uniref:hypothetical protein n=1 Tax=Spirulina subsalsa TaxID=54311 RepID=UPI0002E3436C|nr:hypothetical protein [Spirulina subsalsa]
MSTQEEARKLMVRERKHQNHVQEAMLERATEESANDGLTEEQARVHMAQERQQEELRHEAMLERSAEEIGAH